MTQIPFYMSLSDLDASQAQYVYDLEAIKDQCQTLVSLASAQFQPRYAIKANSQPQILDIIRQSGLWVDCCSEYEVELALRHSLDPHHIQLSSQQCPRQRTKRHQQGIDCIATSLHQLEQFGQQCPHTHIGVRINPGSGSGQFAKINTGGKQSAFGIWHEYISQILDMANKYQLTITKLHIHIGSSHDLQSRSDMLHHCLSLAHHFPKLTTLNMGGGYKVARMSDEKEYNLTDLIQQAKTILKSRNDQHQSQIKLEIEPGAYLVAKHGYIVCQVDDIVDTGTSGYRFVRTNTGMDMIIRPAMYGAQHPIYHFCQQTKQWSQPGSHHYAFVGHCCESSDLLTPLPGTSDQVGTRGFEQVIHIGDTLVIAGAGAYCQSMRCSGYNGYGLDQKTIT